MTQEEIPRLLAFIYGEEVAATIRTRIDDLIQAHKSQNQLRSRAHYFDQRDAVLITYGDMVQHAGERPLRTLGTFLARHLKELVSAVHILPFYPYSSDDGFSVIDYRTVDPELGTWEQVAEIGRDFRLMFDAVINHISAQSRWFQGYLNNDPRYRDYFVTVDPLTDLSSVFRPRTLPLLTEVTTTAGSRYVWTTFSPDQIDLNFANPEILIEILDLILFYVSKGAELIRLDAIAYMWKDIGTSCIHRPQAHAIIQLFRAILDLVAPHVVLITETNVPHEDNISYFGDGRNEAQMVYNFSLPPLILHAFYTGQAEILSSWAQTLTLPSDKVAFFNFLASHDGIGVTPLRGLLPETAISVIVERVLRLGGYVSYRNNPDGSQSAYELNINYLDALADPDRPEEDVALISARFLAAQAIKLALRGVPAIYFHSLFGSRGWPEGVAETGRNRTINRQKLPVERLEMELATPGSRRERIFAGYSTMLRARSTSAAFHPNGGQEVQQLHPAVFAVRRSAPKGGDSVLCWQNVSAESASLALEQGNFTDLLTGLRYRGGSAVILKPYQVMWLLQKS